MLQLLAYLGLRGLSLSLFKFILSNSDVDEPFKPFLASISGRTAFYAKAEIIQARLASWIK